jgi:hypothetical protein
MCACFYMMMMMMMVLPALTQQASLGADGKKKKKRTYSKSSVQDTAEVSIACVYLHSFIIHTYICSSNCACFVSSLIFVCIFN